MGATSNGGLMDSPNASRASPRWGGTMAARAALWRVMALLAVIMAAACCLGAEAEGLGPDEALAAQGGVGATEDVTKVKIPAGSRRQGHGGPLDISTTLGEPRYPSFNPSRCYPVHLVIQL